MLSPVQSPEAEPTPKAAIYQPKNHNTMQLIEILTLSIRCSDQAAIHPRSTKREITLLHKAWAAIAPTMAAPYTAFGKLLTAGDIDGATQLLMDACQIDPVDALIRPGDPNLLQVSKCLSFAAVSIQDAGKHPDR